MPISAELCLRGLPALLITGPLPCDLSHRIELEFEGSPQRVFAGNIAVSGDVNGAQFAELPLAPISSLPLSSIDRPGDTRLARRAHRRRRARLGVAGDSLRLARSH